MASTGKRQQSEDRKAAIRERRERVDAIRGGGVVEVEDEASGEGTDGADGGSAPRPAKTKTKTAKRSHR